MAEQEKTITIENDRLDLVEFGILADQYGSERAKEIIAEANAVADEPFDDEIMEIINGAGPLVDVE